MVKISKLSKYFILCSMFLVCIVYNGCNGSTQITPCPTFPKPSKETLTALLKADKEYTKKLFKLKQKLDVCKNISK